MNALQRVALKTLVRTVGRLSDGVRIAGEDGMTSGRMLDYVYRNRPSGRLWIGKLLDRMYLAHRAWEAVRIRRRHLAELLEGAIRAALRESGRVVVLDIAAGPAAYIQELLLKLPGEPIEATCWDLDERWLAEGRTRAAGRGLGGIRYERGDALDARSFRRLPRRPNVVVASGFYDWMAADRTVQRSMALVHDALAGGGRFVFTAQTGHADLAMVNSVFRGFDGEALRMKTRPLATVHDWARKTGFEIAHWRSDPWGYHAVSVARPRPPAAF